jgi:hypothetical protein
MAIKTKGTTGPVTESVTRDRIGFVNCSVRQIYASEEIATELPGAPYAELLGAIHTRTVVEAADGVATVRWLYEGLGGAVTIYQYEWQGSFETVPIQAHPNYREWIGVYGTVTPQGDFKPYATMPVAADTGLSGDAAADGEKNPLLGVDSYLSIGGVWTRRYASRELPNVMSGIGQIVENPPGPVPRVPSDRNWLKGPPQMTFRGNAWDVTEQWILSGRGGVSELVYGGGAGQKGL